MMGKRSLPFNFFAYLQAFCLDLAHEMHKARRGCYRRNNGYALRVSAIWGRNETPTLGAIADCCIITAQSERVHANRYGLPFFH